MDSNNTEDEEKSKNNSLAEHRSSLAQSRHSRSHAILIPTDKASDLLYGCMSTKDQESSFNELKSMKPYEWRNIPKVLTHCVDLLINNLVYTETNRSELTQSMLTRLLKCEKRTKTVTDQMETFMEEVKNMVRGVEGRSRVELGDFKAIVEADLEQKGKF